MLNKLFFSKKAHRILTILFIASFPLANVNAAWILYWIFYLPYFVIRFIWRIFNKPDISQYEIDKQTMPRKKLMEKYGVYRY